ncbi:MAG: hypothetical protein EOP84_19505 [Verrucomicrobiaceae bacterium]|nr:MAG: hypothetical protein EOP84_19505 [Verrucomicrobiaceae bacterium]
MSVAARDAGAKTKDPFMRLSRISLIGMSLAVAVSAGSAFADELQRGGNVTCKGPFVNTETGDRVILILNRVTDSPESFALFNYEWTDPDLAIQVKKLQQFVLRPKTEERYKLLDIKETEALIELPSGEKYTVTPTPAER